MNLKPGDDWEPAPRPPRHYTQPADSPLESRGDPIPHRQDASRGRTLALVIFVVLGCLLAIWWAWFYSDTWGLNGRPQPGDAVTFLFRVAATLAYLFALKRVFFR